jgi:hypothetical protein
MHKHLIVLLFLFLPVLLISQAVNESATKKFSIGFDIMNDIWQDVPDGIKQKTLNPGINAYGMYNYAIGKSNFSFSPGIGISAHNFYSDAIPELINDSMAMVKIPDTLSYKKAKLTASYIDIPFEFRFKSKKEVRFAVGFKYGFLMKAQSKYKGNDYLNNDDHTVIIKQGKIKHVDSNRYGFIARIGYKWLNISGYYSLSTLFREGKGPEMYPVSVGLTVIPF